MRSEKIHKLLMQAAVAVQAEQYRVAEIKLRRALSSAATDVEVLLHLAYALFKQNKFQECSTFCREALRLAPDNIQAAHNLAQCLDSMELYSDATDLFKVYLKYEANDARAWVRLANTLFKQLRFDEALEACERALEISPQFMGAYNNKALICTAMGRADLALQAYDAALRICPESIEVRSNQSELLREMGLNEQALRVLCPDGFSQSLAVDMNKELAEIDAILEAGVSRRSDCRELADQCFVRGFSLDKLGQSQLALAWYERSLDFGGEHTLAAFNSSLCLLQLRRWEEGFARYEARWGHHDLVSRRVTTPYWDGRVDLMGKRILVWWEQGFGDSLQFCRYVTELANMGAIVHLEVQPQLVNLMRSVPGVADVSAHEGDRPEYDLHCPLMSLPHLLGTKIDNVPSKIPYLSADMPAVARWRELLGEKKRPRIGIVWAGSAHKGVYWYRSVGAQQICDIFTGDVDWIVLQKEVSVDEKNIVEKRCQNIQFFCDALVDFSETAALVANLDLVITTDTAVAHLSAALGMPTWLMLSSNCDWRWLREGATTPWYPDVRLFRQTGKGDWGSVLSEIRRALSAWSEHANVG